jgi:hypothetical protein
VVTGKEFNTISCHCLIWITGKVPASKLNLDDYGVKSGVAVGDGPGISIETTGIADRMHGPCAHSNSGLF